MRATTKVGVKARWPARVQEYRSVQNCFNEATPERLSGKATPHVCLLSRPQRSSRGHDEGLCGSPGFDVAE